MAAALVRKVREETGETPNSLEFSYFTAGTGGVGGTILASTFLLMSEEAQSIEVRTSVKRDLLRSKRDLLTQAQSVEVRTSVKKT